MNEGNKSEVLSDRAMLRGSVRLGRIVKGRRKIRPNAKRPNKKMYEDIIRPNEKKGRILKGITGQKAK